MSSSRFPLALALGGALALAVVAGARPAWLSYRHWRGDRLIETSKRQESEGAMLEAFRSAHAASLLHAESVQARRRLALLASAVGHPDALGFWETLLSREGADAEDFAAGIEAALDAGQIDRANEWARHWKAEGVNPSAPSLAQAEVRLLAARGDWAA